MTERPILMSAPMVRALLAGTKTQTRRMVTVPWRGNWRAYPYSPAWEDEDGKLLCCDEYGDYYPAEECLTAYGKVGDRLWVRETWRGGFDTISSGMHYRADEDECAGGPWKPSIFMPRSASRITLELTGRRIERLQAISAADAIAEGCYHAPWSCPTATLAYRDLWDGINGKKDGCSWADNPWVWVLTFKVVS